MSTYPSSQPIPVAGPTAVPNYDLPNLPANTYQLLNTFADAIDTANIKLNAHASKLHDINSSTNNAVSEVTSTSKGQATDTLSTLWQSSQTDLNTAHSQLATLTTYPGGLGPGNQSAGWSFSFRSVLEENRVAIQTGMLALENLQNQQRNGTATVPMEQMAQWKQEVDTLNGSIMNLNMAVEGMAMAIRNLNNGFSATCATGFTPGGPIPLFTNHAFASQIHGGASGSENGKDAEKRIENVLGKGDESTALMVNALDAGVDLNVIANLLENNKSFDSIKKALTDSQALEGKGISSESINKLFTTKGGDINGATTNVTNLLDQGITSERVNQLIKEGTNLKSANANVTNLLNGGVPVDQVNQWVQAELNLKYSKTLLDKGMSVTDINNRIDMYTDTSKGSENWRKQLEEPEIKQGVNNALKRWEANSSTGQGNDGRVFRNDKIYSKEKKIKIPSFQTPVTGTLREYYVDYPGSERIVIDSSGKAYYFPDDKVHYNPDTRIPIPFSYMIKILGG